jgi:8-oxo-dGTP pyrophosphatase MutT (NUDIX family)
MASSSSPAGGAAAAAADAPASVTINGAAVPVTAVPQTPPLNVALALASAPFAAWARELDPRFAVTAVLLQGLDMFGPRVGFVKFAVQGTFQGKPVPGVVFARGGAVAILPVLTCGAERWVVCCRQPRLPVGRHFLEIPAGMMDGKGSFVGVAAKEMAEETGIEIHEGDLQDLTQLAYGPGEPCGPGGHEAAAAGGALHGMYPSVGGCDVRGGGQAAGEGGDGGWGGACARARPCSSCARIHARIPLTHTHTPPRQFPSTHLTGVHSHHVLYKGG